MTHDKLNILVLGSGGREHALCWKIKQSPLAGALYCAPGNGGTGLVAQNVDLNPENATEVISFCQKRYMSFNSLR